MVGLKGNVGGQDNYAKRRTFYWHPSLGKTHKKSFFLVVGFFLHAFSIHFRPSSGEKKCKKVFSNQCALGRGEGYQTLSGSTTTKIFFSCVSSLTGKQCCWACPWRWPPSPCCSGPCRSGCTASCAYQAETGSSNWNQTKKNQWYCV